MFLRYVAFQYFNQCGCHTLQEYSYAWCYGTGAVAQRFKQRLCAVVKYIFFRPVVLIYRVDLPVPAGLEKKNVCKPPNI